MAFHVLILQSATNAQVLSGTSSGIGNLTANFFRIPLMIAPFHGSGTFSAGEPTTPDRAWKVAIADSMARDVISNFSD